MNTASTELSFQENSYLLILGAGPCGLGAAYQLNKLDIKLHLV
jgi:cation diffusion facilitator CzcD-associated flavoprotein CzcO